MVGIASQNVRVYEEHLYAAFQPQNQVRKVRASKQNQCSQGLPVPEGLFNPEDDLETFHRCSTHRTGTPSHKNNSFHVLLSASVFPLGAMGRIRPTDPKGIGNVVL